MTSLKPRDFSAQPIVTMPCDPDLGVHGHSQDDVSMTSSCNVATCYGCHCVTHFDPLTNQSLPNMLATWQPLVTPLTLLTSLDDVSCCVVHATMLCPVIFCHMFELPHHHIEPSVSLPCHHIELIKIGQVSICHIAISSQSKLAKS